MEKDGGGAEHARTTRTTDGEERGVEEDRQIIPLDGWLEWMVVMTRAATHNCNLK